MVISLDPRVLGSPVLTWAGAAAIIATALVIAAVVLQARSMGVSRTDAYAVSVRAALWGILAARLLHVVDYLGYYGQVPLQVLYVWNGGFAAWGAILGALAGGFFHARRRGLPAERLAGIAMLPGLGAIALFRLVDFLTGQRPGSETLLPWGVVYAHPASAAYLPGVTQHPVGLYELLLLLPLGLGLLLMGPLFASPLNRLKQRINGNVSDGHSLLVALGAYAAIRFVTGFASIGPVHLGLLQSQWIGLLALLGIGIWGVQRQRREVRRKRTKTAFETAKVGKP